MATVTRKPRTQVVRQPVEREGGFRRIFTPARLTFLAVLGLISLSVIVFFYFKYSRMIDARLRGDVLVRTTGIYAAPRSIRVGQAMQLGALKSYLDGIGYVESSKEADAKRGRYLIKGNTIEIHTSADAIINGVRQFPKLSVTFGSTGRAISKIVEIDSRRNLDSSIIEPELMTAISHEKRQKQKHVSFRDLPDEYVKAVLAIEDRQFFEHAGINIRGILRALWRDAGEGEFEQGGSSLTQQLVKNFFLTPERTFKRKIQEMMIALVLENKLTKEQIFEMYANEVYMGQSGSYSINGVGEAASVYFNKDVVNLTLPEAAFLAGIIRGPSLYSPYRDLERAKARRNQVLDSMAEVGFISREHANQTKSVALKIQPKRSALNVGAPYFVDYLQQQLASDLRTGDFGRQSYRVYTTIDMDLQRAADKAVGDTLAKLDPIFAKRKKNPVPPGTLQAALVALNPKTGEILAMVGGRDYAQSQLNRAVDANRQPGSVFKPIVYAAALNSAYEYADSEVITPATLFMDAPETFLYGRGQTYSPENYGKTYSNREVTLRDGLVHSLNVVTVRIAERVGYAKVARMAERMGLPRPQALPAVALGTAEATPLKIASAYTVFANGGTLVDARPTRRLTNSDGVTVVEAATQRRPVLQPALSWIMTNIMEDVLTNGTGARARAMGFSGTAAGKTGTSRDGWFAGFTPNLVCVVWVGFDDNSELGLEGSKSALPIWAAFMKQARMLRPDLGGDSFPQPEGVVSSEIDPTTGLLATDTCPGSRLEHFIEGTAPDEDCAAHSGDDFPDLIPFEWPEGHDDIPRKTRELMQEAEKAIEKGQREIQKQMEELLPKPRQQDPPAIPRQQDPSSRPRQQVLPRPPQP